MSQIRSVAALLAWEFARLGPVVLAFWATLGATHAFAATWFLEPFPSFFMAAHANLSLLVALLLGGLWAGGGIEEGNLEFLLARNLSRTTVFATTHLVGAGLTAIHALGPMAVEPFARSFPQFLPGLAAAYFLASAASGLLDRPAAGIPVAGVGLVGLWFVAVLAEARFRFLDLDPLSMLLCVAAVLGAVLGWATVQCHRDRELRRRLLAILGVAGGIALAATFALAIGRGTVSIDEAVDDLATDRNHMLLDFDRPLATSALRRRLTGTNDPDEQTALEWALHRFGEEDATRWFQDEWVRRDARGEGLRWTDLDVLSEIDPDEVEPPARRAVLSMGRRMAGLSGSDAWVSDFKMLLSEVVFAMARLDREAAWEAWQPLVERFLAAGNWRDAQSLLRPPSWEHMRNSRTAIPIDFADRLPAESVRRLLEAALRAEEVDEVNDALLWLLGHARRPESVRAAYRLLVGDGQGPSLTEFASAFPADQYPAILPLLLADAPTGSPPGSDREARLRAAALYVALASGDESGLRRMEAEFALLAPRCPDLGDEILYLRRPEVNQILAEGDPRSSAGEVAGILVGRAGAAERFLERLPPPPMIAGLFEPAARIDGRDLELLLLAVESSDHPALVEAAIRQARHSWHSWPAERLEVLAAIARGGHRAGLAGLVDALDGPGGGLYWRSNIRFAARVLEETTGESFGTDSAAWRRWLGEDP